MTVKEDLENNLYRLEQKDSGGQGDEEGKNKGREGGRKEKEQKKQGKRMREGGKGRGKWGGREADRIPDTFKHNERKHAILDFVDELMQKSQGAEKTREGEREGLK